MKFPRWRNGRAAFAFAQLAAFLALACSLRLALEIFLGPGRKVGIADHLQAFAVGLHLDLVASLCVLLPAVWLASLVSPRRWASPWFRRTWFALGIAIWLALVFLHVAEGFFFEEYQSRVNPVAIDYLVYPHEVFVNIWEAYPVPLVVALCLALATAIVWLTARHVRRRELTSEPRQGKLFFAWTTLAILGVASLRLYDPRFSRERALNEIANNTFLSAYAAVATRNLDYPHFYPTIDRAEAYAAARDALARPGIDFTGPTDSLLRHVPGDTNRPRLNVVFLFEESLGSEFFGCLGRTGPSLTPRLDEIVTRDALIFDNFYADGNRTIRGYEAAYASFPPLPGDSIVARDRTENVETLATLLGRDGYDTTFIYAGRGSFDGTGPFAIKNGWQHFLELKDFERPVFTTVWGVCNEDLYDRVLVEARRKHVAGQPFFITTMSVSNHKPFTYPAGRIPEDPLARTREHAVKYSDFALGRFFDQARKEPFWTNTIFCVAGDHGARVYGSQTIPIRSYEVPFIVVGPSVVPLPRRVSKLGCQLDLAPTLLGLIGRPYDTTFYGQDLLRQPEGTSRVLLHHNRSVGIYRDQHLVIFNLNKKIEYFLGDPKTGQMQRADTVDDFSKALVREATALFQVGDDLYMNRRYRVPSSGAAGAPGAKR